MKAVFAGTWFFQAMLSERDKHHDAVVRYLGKYDDFLVTTRWVLTEMANAAAGSAYRDQAARFLMTVEQYPNVTVVKSSDALYERGLELFELRSDKGWSLTDRHFAQAGFRPVFGEGQ